jgi:ABC-2 type transport system permease protein
MMFSQLLRVAGSFLWRDLLSMRPWRWVFDWLDAGFSVALWYFVTRLFGAAHFSEGKSAGDYFTFSLIGLALTQYVWRGFSALSSRIRNEQSSGSLEPLWVTAYPLPLLILLGSLWDFFSATVNAGIILLIGAYGFGAQLQWGSMIAILGIGFLTSLGMAFLGLLVASWVIASGQGDIFRPLLNKIIPLISGAFFPLALLPGWAQSLAACSPLTHALVLSRGFLTGSTEGQMSSAWLSLGGITVLLGVAGWGALVLALHQARVNGRLAAA